MLSAAEPERGGATMVAERWPAAVYRGRVSASQSMPTQEVSDVKSRHGSSAFSTAGAALLAAGVLLLAGCFSFDVGSAISRQIAPKPEPPAQSAPQNDQAAAQQPKPRGGGSAAVYQYQFSALYGGFWNMGWFGYNDVNYTPGQGTRWVFTDSRKAKETMTLERALLKVNADSSQWWRFTYESGEDSILYEFLVAPDSTVKKVRFKDPDTGTVEEFVPSQDQQQPAAGPAPKSREEIAKYKVDKQKVTVKAGTFDTDHYRYTDETQKGTAENWISSAVPGYMVKTVYTSEGNKQTVTGELVQIETGITTVLGSF
jgi:hypothetical protein